MSQFPYLAISISPVSIRHKRSKFATAAFYSIFFFPAFFIAPAPKSETLPGMAPVPIRVSNFDG